jgi:hypothetical protein
LLVPGRCRRTPAIRCPASPPARCLWRELVRCRVPPPGRAPAQGRSSGKGRVPCRVRRPGRCRGRVTPLRRAGVRRPGRRVRSAVRVAAPCRVPRTPRAGVAEPGRWRRKTGPAHARRPGRCRRQAGPCRRRPVPAAAADGLPAPDGRRPATTEAAIPPSRRGTACRRPTRASGTASPALACPVTEDPVSIGMAVTRVDEPE